MATGMSRRWILLCWPHRPGEASRQRARRTTVDALEGRETSIAVDKPKTSFGRTGAGRSSLNPKGC